MRSITFNKKEETALCMFCKKNRVPMKRWNKPCDACKSPKAGKAMKVSSGVAKRQPAAVWEDEHGNKVVVDKFGKVVEDHGYDFENDPRGYKTTGTVGSKKEIII